MTKQKTYKSFIYIFGFVLNASLGAFLVGYKLAELNLLIVDLKHIYFLSEANSSIFSGLLNAMLPIGAIIGAILSGNFFSKLGRKWGLIIADIFGALGSFICIFQGDNASTQIIGRILSGISVGVNSHLVPIYINELAPQEISGFMGSFFQSFSNIGILIAYLMGLNLPKNEINYDITDNWWKFVFALPIITCVIRSSLLLTYYNFDTPYSLLKRNKGDEASWILKKIYLDEFIDEQVHILDEKIKIYQVVSFNQLFHIYRSRLILGLVLMSVQQLSGINAVVAESSTLFNSSGNDDEVKVWVLTIICSIVLFIASFISGLTSDRIGRKTLILYGNLACFISLFLMGIFMEFDNTTINDISILMTFFFLFFFGISLGPIAWIYAPEILPDKGISLTVISNWFFCGLVVFLTPLSIESIGISGVYFIFASFLFVSQFYFYYAMKETKGKNAVEINELFGTYQSYERKEESNNEKDFNSEMMGTMI